MGKRLLNFGNNERNQTHKVNYVCFFKKKPQLLYFKNRMKGNWINRSYDPTEGLQVKLVNYSQAPAFAPSHNRLR